MWFYNNKTWSYFTSHKKYAYRLIYNKIIHFKYEHGLKFCCVTTRLCISIFKLFIITFQVDNILSFQQLPFQDISRSTFLKILHSFFKYHEKMVQQAKNCQLSERGSGYDVIHSWGNDTNMNCKTKGELLEQMTLVLY